MILVVYGLEMSLPSVTTHFAIVSFLFRLTNESEHDTSLSKCEPWCEHVDPRLIYVERPCAARGMCDAFLRPVARRDDRDDPRAVYLTTLTKLPWVLK